MNKERWNKIGRPVPVSKEYPCEPGDVLSRFGGFHLSLVLEVDEDGLPAAMLPTKGDVIVVNEDIAAKDDGTLYHTDLTSTEEKWNRTSPYVFWKINDKIHQRLWSVLLRKESVPVERRTKVSGSHPCFVVYTGKERRPSFERWLKNEGFRLRDTYGGGVPWVHVYLENREYCWGRGGVGRGYSIGDHAITIEDFETIYNIYKKYEGLHFMDVTGDGPNWEG